MQHILFWAWGRLQSWQHCCAESREVDLIDKKEERGHIQQYPSAWKMHQNTRDSRCSALYSITLSDQSKRFLRKAAMTPPSSLICVLQHSLRQTAPELSPLTQALLCFYWKLNSSSNNSTDSPRQHRNQAEQGAAAHSHTHVYKHSQTAGKVGVFIMPH